MSKSDKTFLNNNLYLLFFRSFGWIVLGLVASFLINNILIISFNFPTFYNLFKNFDYSFKLFNTAKIYSYFQITIYFKLKTYKFNNNI